MVVTPGELDGSMIRDTCSPDFRNGLARTQHLQKKWDHLLSLLLLLRLLVLRLLVLLVLLVLLRLLLLLLLLLLRWWRREVRWRGL